MNPFQTAIQIVKYHRKAYLAINLSYYALIVIGLVYGAIDREVQKAITEAVGAAFTSGPLQAVGEAYTGQEFLRAVLLTFLINLFLGSLAVLTLPSLAIPFSGMLVGAYRAILWGVIYSPGSLQTDAQGLLFVVFIAGLLFLEGQGYILALLGVYIQGRAFLFPKRAGLERHGQGYLVGLKRTASLYILVTLVLLVAAVYEAGVAIAFLP
jgi:hypothetical protein